MRGPFLIVLIAIAGAATIALTSSDRMPSEATSRRDEPRDPAEIVRIRAHLLQAERELLVANVSSLSPRQLHNRARHIETLRRYREQGVFPHNHVVSDRRVPVFIDEHGTHCAVGHLIAQSGKTQLARRISAQRNLARVPELTDERELVAWLDDAGLSLAEAARIQPTYGPRRDETRYPLFTAAAVGAAAGVSALNLMADREGSTWWLPGALGLASGAAAGTVALLAHRDDRPNDDINSRLIGVNVAAGLLSGFVGTRALVLGRADQDRVGNQSGAPGALQLSLAPWTSTDGIGASVHLRF